MLLRPGFLESSDGRRRQPAGILAEQRDQRLLEVAGGDALEVEDRDQHLEALRSAGVGRQNRRREADALRALANAITHARTARPDCCSRKSKKPKSSECAQRIGLPARGGYLFDVSNRRRPFPPDFIEPCLPTPREQAADGSRLAA